LKIVDKLSTIVDEMSTKNLANALFPITRLSILRELVLSADKSIHLRELARRTGLDPRGVQREARNLLEVGILVEEKSGNQRLYRINRKCPIYSELKMLILKTVGVADELRKTLEPLKNKMKMAYIYGSFASGTFTSESDIDLLVVGDLSLKTVISAISETGRKLSRVINSTVISPEKYEKERREQNSFINRIDTNQKIILFGDENDS